MHFNFTYFACMILGRFNMEVLWFAQTFEAGEKRRYEVVKWVVDILINFGFGYLFEFNPNIFITCAVCLLGQWWGMVTSGIVKQRKLPSIKVCVKYFELSFLTNTIGPISTAAQILPSYYLVDKHWALSMSYTGGGLPTIVWITRTIILVFLWRMWAEKNKKSGGGDSSRLFSFYTDLCGITNVGLSMPGYCVLLSQTRQEARICAVMQLFTELVGRSYTIYGTAKEVKKIMKAKQNKKLCKAMRKRSAAINKFTVATQEAGVNEALDGADIDDGIDTKLVYESIIKAMRYMLAPRYTGELIGEKVLLFSGPFVIVFLLSSVMPVDGKSVFEVGGTYVGMEFFTDIGLVWALMGYFLIPMTSIKSEPLFSEKGKKSMIVYAFAINGMGCTIAGIYMYAEEKYGS